MRPSISQYPPSRGPGYRYSKHSSLTALRRFSAWLLDWRGSGRRRLDDWLCRRPNIWDFIALLFRIWNFGWCLIGNVAHHISQENDAGRGPVSFCGASPRVHEGSADGGPPATSEVGERRVEMASAPGHKRISALLAYPGPSICASAFPKLRPRSELRSQARLRESPMAALAPRRSHAGWRYCRR
jgi:hypothetical protein